MKITWYQSELVLFLYIKMLIAISREATKIIIQKYSKTNDKGIKMVHWKIHYLTQKKIGSNEDWGIKETYRKQLVKWHKFFLIGNSLKWPSRQQNRNFSVYNKKHTLWKNGLESHK